MTPSSHANDRPVRHPDDVVPAHNIPPGPLLYLQGRPIYLRGPRAISAPCRDSSRCPRLAPSILGQCQLKSGASSRMAQRLQGHPCLHPLGEVRSSCMNQAWAARHPGLMLSQPSVRCPRPHDLSPPFSPTRPRFFPFCLHMSGICQPLRSFLQAFPCTIFSRGLLVIGARFIYLLSFGFAGRSIPSETSFRTRSFLFS